MSINQNKHYQWVWEFLEQKLSTEEVETFMSWLEEEPRNQEFFDEVVKDYELFLESSISTHLSKENHPDQSTKKLNIHPLFFKIAAGITLLIGLAYVFMVSDGKENLDFKTYLLYDGTEIILTEDSQLIYDSIRFPETHSLQIRGKARVIPPKNKESLLLIETELGYYLSENAEFTINNQTDRNLEIEMYSGEAQWLNFEGEKIEVVVESGEKLLVQRKHGNFYKQNLGIATKDKEQPPFFKNNLLKLII